MNWATADPHVFHRQSIERGWRSFDSVEHMNETIVENWNSRVRKKDDVYVLGDFTFGKEEETQELFNRLAGYKHLIIGNHDFKWRLELGWKSVGHYRYVRDGNLRAVCSHYPMIVWPEMQHGTVMLHGHCHGHLKPEVVDFIGWPIIDVGMDANGFAPISFDQIKQRVDSGVYSRPKWDHHTE